MRKTNFSVGVLIDLKWHPHAGGQVKCWERIAEAAADLKDRIHLTLHLQGDKSRLLQLSENTRMIMLPPILSTTRFRPMEHIPDHTDLSPFHIRLYPYLKTYDVIHTTDAFFAQSRTALFTSKRYGIPLISSIHTDIPGYTKIYTRPIFERFFRNRALCRLLLDRWRMDDFFTDYMHRRLHRFLKYCHWIFVSKAEDLPGMRKDLNRKNISYLRRGIDMRLFNPGQRDRRRVKDLFHIEEDQFLLLFVGRMDPGKNIMTLAKATRSLLDRGESLRVIVAGEGNQKGTIRDMLGPAVRFTGAVPQSTLAWLYASADAFVFPSEIEVCPNVVIEARSSGLPVLIPSRGGAAQLIKKPDDDGILIRGNGLVSWIGAIEGLLQNPVRCKQIGEKARKIIESEWPSWKEVLEDDLLPVWRKLAEVNR